MFSALALAFVLPGGADAVADPSIDNVMRRRRAWEAWVDHLDNSQVFHQVHDLSAFGMRLRVGLLSLGTYDWREQRARFEELRALPLPEAIRLQRRLHAAVADPDRFAAAHVALWHLYQFVDGLRGGTRSYGGLHLVPTYLGLRDSGDLRDPVALPAPFGTRVDRLPFLVRFPDPLAQSARLHRQWDEYFRGERTALFDPARERPALAPETREAFSVAQSLTYAVTSPPRPDGSDSMTARELEAYYGAPPDVPADFDPADVMTEPQEAASCGFPWPFPDEDDADEAPPDFHPPPVPDWRRRAGLSPAP